MNKTLVQQMAMYTAYHRQLGTKLTHVVGVPAVAFSLLVPMALLEFVDLGPYTVSLATVFAAVVMAYWVILDVSLGTSTTLLFLPLVYLAGDAAQRGAQYAWVTFGLFFLGGWILQLVGHGVFEKRKPALTDSFVQIFIAPMFLVAEGVFFLGGRKDLEAVIADRSKAFD